MGFEPEILRSRVHGEIYHPGGDLVDDLLTPSAGTLALAFTIYKTGDKLSQLVIHVYFISLVLGRERHHCS